MEFNLLGNYSSGMDLTDGAQNIYAELETVDVSGSNIIGLKK